VYVKCSFYSKICAIKRYVQLICEYKVNVLACLDIPGPCMSAYGERICKCSCLCVCVCLSVSARQYKPVTWSKSSVSGKTSFSGHVANVVVLCPCRRSGSVNSVTLYSLVVTVHTVYVYHVWYVCVCVCVCVCVM
jgi:hypothetical protein